MQKGYKGLALTCTLFINKQHVKRLKLANSLTETVRQLLDNNVRVF